MHMGRTPDEVINKLPPDRQAHIALLAEKKWMTCTWPEDLTDENGGNSCIDA
jgi:hypothetical protein